MALPAGALGATVTVGSPIDIAGTAGTLVSLRVRPEVPAGLVWAADGIPVEPWSASAALGGAPVTTLTLTILADQEGVLTSGTVDGAPQMVVIRSWPLVAEWRTKPTANAAPTKHVRRFAAPAPGTTVDLDLLPQDGVLPVATITTVQSLYIGADAVPQVQQDATTATAAAAAAALSETAASGAATTASGAATVATAAQDAARLAEIDAEAAAEAAVAARGSAEGARDAASGSALSASGSATVATTKAGEADRLALDAAASASAAAASADTASTQAGVASDKATEATTKAAEASASAASASGSASTATTKAGEAAASAASAAATLADAVPKSIVDAKGDLLVGSANDTLSRLAVGPNGSLLMADSNAASGLSYLTQNTATNLIQNGDFSNGTTGWSGDLTVAGGVASFTPTAKYLSSAAQPVAVRAGSAYYFSARIKSADVRAALALSDNKNWTWIAEVGVANTWTTVSLVTPVLAAVGPASGLLVRSNGDVWSLIEFSNVFVIDLTAAFGAGSEPTKSEMDLLLTNYPNGWFNGTVNDLVPRYNPMRRVGRGSPYSVITPRKIGEAWTDTAQTCGARVWTATGTTTTSWVVTDGDTGTRILTSWTAAGVVAGDALPANVAPTAGSAGSVRVQRRGAQVLYAIRGATWSGASAFTVPVGFRSATAQYRPTSVIVAGAPAAMAATVSTTTLTIGASGQSAHATNATVVTWESDPWTTTPPGTPA